MSKHPEETKAEKAPLWILSFGDMITNFLAFFILLQSFSHAQQADFLQNGETGGMTSVANFGNAPGWLFGKNSQAEFGFWHRKHPMEGDPENMTVQRVIDAEDEEIRKIFDDLRRAMNTDAARRDRPRTQLFPTPIRFAPASAALDATAMDYLATFASELTQAEGIQNSSIYVIATAETDSAAVVTSSLRAQAVRDCLARNLPPEVRGNGQRLLSWGTGTPPAAGLNPALAAAASSARAAGAGAAKAVAPSIVIAVVEQTREE
jgi:hypothetical protein